MKIIKLPEYIFESICAIFFKFNYQKMRNNRRTESMNESLMDEYV